MSSPLNASLFQLPYKNFGEKKKGLYYYSFIALPSGIWPHCYTEIFIPKAISNFLINIEN